MSRKSGTISDFCAILYDSVTAAWMHKDACTLASEASPPIKLNLVVSFATHYVQL